MEGRQNIDSIKSKEFIKFMGDADLINLGYFGPRFTCCNNHSRAARIWKMIDRVLATVGWIQRFSGHNVQQLLRIA